MHSHHRFGGFEINHNRRHFSEMVTIRVNPWGWYPSDLYFGCFIHRQDMQKPTENRSFGFVEILSSTLVLLVWSDIFIWLVVSKPFFVFHNAWDNPSHWLMFFRGVGIPPTSHASTASICTSGEPQHDCGARPRAPIGACSPAPSLWAAAKRIGRYMVRLELANWDSSRWFML